MLVSKEKVLALAAGLTLYLLFGPKLEEYRALVDSMVIAEFVSRLLER